MGIRVTFRRLIHATGGVPLLYLLTVVLLYVRSSVWHLLPCLWTALVSLVVVVVTARGVLEVTRMRRRAWLDYYFLHEGTLHRVLRGGLLMQTLSVALATGLAFVVLAQAPVWTSWHWSVLALSGFVLFPIQERVWGRSAMKSLGKSPTNIDSRSIGGWPSWKKRCTTRPLASMTQASSMF